MDDSLIIYVVASMVTVMAISCWRRRCQKSLAPVPSGYGKVFKSHLFGKPTIVSTDPEVSKFILQSVSEDFVPFFPGSLTELVGKSSILVINGSLQRRVHGLIGSFFKSPILKAHITADMQRDLQEIMASWRDDQIVYIQEEAKYMVFQIMVKTLIGLGPGEHLQFLRHQYQKFVAGIISIPVKIPGTRFYRSLQAKKRMMKLVKYIIQEKKKNNTGCISRDIIDAFLNDGSGQLTDDLILDNVIDLMIPAEDSVPVLITLAIKYLSDCPLVLQKLKEENTKLKHKSLEGEDLQWMDYMSLSFTQNVISETLRMGNIIPAVMRKAIKDVEVKDHFIPEGWCVLPYFRSVHLDKEIYDDAYKFNPWRWKDKDTAASSFTPFGGGQRLCPGIDLSRLIASIFLHHLVTGFTWVAEEDHMVNFPTVRMQRNMPIKVKRKNIDILLS
ncbi:uncharacterized protein A4U43_C03F29980 [Asparagus officinalis]|uniref:Cytochrome P450 90D2 n=1 Tax=Asparagus officinalis TaxID=4686 RepID=A0A5P1FI81_ASPOF|nr:uncharacterized protein A4U43_C03F29980 [Asparagus officinalis]